MAPIPCSVDVVAVATEPSGACGASVDRIPPIVGPTPLRRSSLPPTSCGSLRGLHPNHLHLRYPSFRGRRRYPQDPLLRYPSSRGSVVPRLPTPVVPIEPRASAVPPLPTPRVPVEQRASAVPPPLKIALYSCESGLAELRPRIFPRPPKDSTRLLRSHPENTRNPIYLYFPIYFSSFTTQLLFLLLLLLLRLTLLLLLLLFLSLYFLTPLFSFSYFHLFSHIFSLIVRYIFAMIKRAPTRYSTTTTTTTTAAIVIK